MTKNIRSQIWLYPMRHNITYQMKQWGFVALDLGYNTTYRPINDKFDMHIVELRWDIFLTSQHVAHQHFREHSSANVDYNELLGHNTMKIAQISGIHR